MSFKNCSFLIEDYQVFTTPLSNATSKEPNGSKLENYRDVIETFCLEEKCSIFPKDTFGFLLISSLIEPRYKLPMDVPTATLIPF